MTLGETLTFVILIHMSSALASEPGKEEQRPGVRKTPRITMSRLLFIFDTTLFPGFQAYNALYY
jgi:hypothetical protein